MALASAPGSPTDSSESGVRPGRGAIRAFLIACGLTLALAAPVLRAPHERLFGSEVVGRHHDPFTVIEQFRRPQALSLYSQPAVDWVGAALAPLVGAVTAYNLVVLASFPLSALTAYVLARHVTREHGPSLVAALVYAFSPFHVAHAAYHPHAAQTQWIPLYLWALWKALESPNARRLVALVGAAAVTALSNWYAGLVAAVVTPPALLACAWARRSGPGAVVRVALALALPAAAAGLTLLHFFPGLSAAGSPFAFPRSDLFLFSARWWSFALPAVDHPLFGGWVRGLWDRYGIGDGLLEQQVGVGLSWMALAALPPISWWRGAREGPWRWVPVLSALALWAALCALSPERTVFGLAFYRPSHFLHALLPMFRAYARFGQVVGLMVALQAGLGLALLWRRSRPWKLLAAGLVVLGALEHAPVPPWRWRDVLPTRAHRIVAGLPAPVRLMDCAPPGRVQEASVPQLLRHPMSFLGGPVPDCAEPQLGGKLAALGFTHLIRRTGSPENAPAEPSASPGLTLLARAADSTLYRVAAPVPPLYLSDLTGFGPRESGARSTWRWMGASGTARLVNTTATTLNASVELELESWPAARAVEIRLAGSQAWLRRLPAGRSWQLLGPMPLPPGSSELIFRPLSPPVTADDVLRNGDPRRLSIALHGWRLSMEKR